MIPIPCFAYWHYIAEFGMFYFHSKVVVLKNDVLVASFERNKHVTVHQ
jgi:hypothetical protein